MPKKKVLGCRHDYERPPFWVRLPLYLASYGHEHFVDYRISLQRRYIKAQRDNSLAAARRLAKKEAVIHWCTAGERIFWPILRLGSNVMRWLFSGAS